MTLSESDGKLFYQLFLPLIDYVNEKKSVSKLLGKAEGAESIDAAEVKKVADVLWADTSLIDEYLKTPKTAAIPEDQRAILEGWKLAIPGRYVVERHLKKGSIFISAENNEVYQVIGIISDWDEMVPEFALPVAMQATLLPWRGYIITDGLINIFPVSFGGGVKQMLRETYMNAKRSGRVHTSLIVSQERKDSEKKREAVKENKAAKESKAPKENKTTKKSKTGEKQYPEFGKRYTLKVYPSGHSREAYRTIEIAGKETLDRLCSVILDAFDFTDEHLYEFCMDNKMYSGGLHYTPVPQFGNDRSSNRPLAGIRLTKGQNFLFHYDFGDDWRFTIHVQKIQEHISYAPPRVIASKGTVTQYPDWDDESDDDQ